jgi:hypothetical protein
MFALRHTASRNGRRISPHHHGKVRNGLRWGLVDWPELLTSWTVKYHALDLVDLSDGAQGMQPASKTRHEVSRMVISRRVRQNEQEPLLVAQHISVASTTGGIVHQGE